jgi:hypothetical protein
MSAPPVAPKGIEQERCEQALWLLKKALEAASERTSPRIGMARKLVGSFRVEVDASGNPRLNSALVASDGRWKEKSGAPAKHALRLFLAKCPVELPEDLQSPHARFLIDIEKVRGPGNFEFRFGRSGTRPHGEISGINDYGFEALERLLPKIGKIKHVRLLLRTARSADRLCAHLFSRGLDVEVHLQDPSAGFLTPESRADITSSTRKLERDWDVLARGIGSLRVFHSIPCATMRAIQIDDHFVACGWITYVEETALGKSDRRGFRSKRRLKNTPVRDIKIDAVGSLLPFLLLEAGHQWFDTINKMFEACYSNARAVARQPVATRGNPSRVSDRS